MFNPPLPNTVDFMVLEVQFTVYLMGLEVPLTVDLIEFYSK